MPRINIEDKLWSDARFENLRDAIGPDKAVSHLVKLWKYAQQYWKQGKLIPTDVFSMSGISETIVIVGLAERRPEGVYAKGSEEHFAWLLQRVEAGKRSGEKRGKSAVVRKQSVNEQNQAHNFNGTPTTVERNANGIEPLSLSLPLSLSQSLNTKKEKQKNTFPSGRQSSQANTTPTKNLNSYEAVGIFCREYKARYGVSYRVDGKDSSLLGGLRTSYGPEVFERLVKAYMAMTDTWFLTKRHDVMTLKQNVAKVSHFEQTGIHVTQKQIRDADRNAANMELIKAAERGDI